jgi:hypothetical protein
MLYQLSYFRITATVVVVQLCKDKNFFILASVSSKKISLLQQFFYPVQLHQGLYRGQGVDINTDDLIPNLLK